MNDDLQIVPIEPEKPQMTVFGTNDPMGVLERASAVANALKPIIDNRKLFKEISGRKHVYVEGWTNMIAMLGVFPHVLSCVRIDREDEVAYEAKVELRTLNGQAVGAGEALCSSRERNWTNRDEFTIKSMAQTRAVGKACRLSFSWLIGMAGYDGTPAEEMPAEERAPIQTPKPIAKQAPLPSSDLSGDKISEKQRKLIFARCKAAGIPEEGLRGYLKTTFGIDHTSDISWRDMDKVLGWIDNEPPSA